MAGTITLSLTQQTDQYGDPLSGGALYFFVAGTVSTPQNAFQDLGLTLPWPNPITLDASGRVPQLFIADGFIKIRLISSDGVTQLVADNVQVIGSSSGSSSGPTIDVTKQASTGDLKARYDTGTHSGWVRANGNTIGSSTAIPAATEPGGSGIGAQPLFLHLYGADSTLVVSGGRTGNALNDWNAGKTIALPDWRGVTLVGLDGMGNTLAGRLSAPTFANPDVLGTLGGVQSYALLRANLPNVTLTTTIPANTYNHGHTATTTAAVGSLQGNPGSGDFLTSGVGTVTIATATIGAKSGTWTPTGGTDTPHTNVQPSRTATIYIKL